MSLQDLNLKKLYQTRRDDVVESLLAPALRESVKYDRGSGYFSLGALAEIADGLIPFIKHGGTIRVVTSVELGADDAKAIHDGMELRESRVVSLLHKRIIETIDDEGALHNLDLITNLIAAGQLEIKIAYMPDGIYHEKIGLFQDSSVKNSKRR